MAKDCIFQDFLGKSLRMKTQKSKNRQKEFLKEKQTKMKLCFGNLACKVCDKMKQNLVFFFEKTSSFTQDFLCFQQDEKF